MLSKKKLLKSKSLQLKKSVQLIDKLVNFADIFKKTAYYQGTKNPDEKDNNLDIPNLEPNQPRSSYISFKNYDYSEEGPSEVSPGGGLYHGEMDKYDSVRDFLNKRRKDNKNLKRNK